MVPRKPEFNNVKISPVSKQKHFIHYTYTRVHTCTRACPGKDGRQDMRDGT